MYVTPTLSMTNILEKIPVISLHGPMNSTVKITIRIQEIQQDSRSDRWKYHRLKVTFKMIIISLKIKNVALGESTKTSCIILTWWSLCYHYLYDQNNQTITLQMKPGLSVLDTMRSGHESNLTRDVENTWQ